MECSSSSLSSKTESPRPQSLSKSSMNLPVAETGTSEDRTEPAKKGSGTDSRNRDDGDKGDTRSRNRRSHRSSKRSRRSRSRSRSDSRNRGRGRSRSRSPRRRRRSRERQAEADRSSSSSFGGDRKPTINPWAVPSGEQQMAQRERASEDDVSMRLLKESLGGGAGEEAIDINRGMTRHGPDGDRRRNRSGGDGTFGGVNRGGIFGSASRGGFDRNDPFGGAMQRPDFNHIEGFGSQFQCIETEDKWNERNRGLMRGRDEGHGVDDWRQERAGNRGGQPIPDRHRGEPMAIGPQSQVPNQGHQNWAGPGNGSDRPPFWNWDQGCNARGSQFQKPGSGRNFGQEQPLGRGRGLAGLGLQRGSRDDFNSGGIGGGRGKFGHAGNDGRRDLDPEQSDANVREHFDNQWMGGFQRADDQGEVGFRRIPDVALVRSGQSRSGLETREGRGPTQQTRHVQASDEDRRSWSDGRENRPVARFFGPPDHHNNEQPPRPLPQGEISNVDQSQQSSRNFERVGGPRDGFSFGQGQFRAGMRQEGGLPNSGPHTGSENKGSRREGDGQGGSVFNERGPRQRVTDWSRDGPTFKRSHDPQQGPSAIGVFPFDRQRRPPLNEPSQRGPESEPFNHPPGAGAGRDPFCGPEQSRARHERDIHQSRAPVPALRLGNRDFLGPQDGPGRQAHTETDFCLAGFQGNHPPPQLHQDAGPSAHPGGHLLGGNPESNWNRAQRKDPPNESMQDLVRRSKQFQSKRRQSPDREQFMNPPNPNATPPGGDILDASAQGASTSTVVTDTSGAPAPDYKALLQYLQFYQKQMGGANPDNK